MGIRHDVEEGLKKYEITRIEGQPTDEQLNLLTKELTNAAGSVATQNGGGEHGHVGMVVEQAEYITFSRGGAPFVIPTNPGLYPATVDADAVIRERQIAEHKAEIVEYETYLGVKNYLRRMIVKSVDHKWIAEVESETMGFNHLSPMQLLTHRRSVGGSLDHMDITDLIANLQKPWDGIETHASHFARGDKYERQLLKCGQARNPELQLVLRLQDSKHQENTTHLSASGTQSHKSTRHLRTFAFSCRRNMENTTSRTSRPQHQSDEALPTALQTSKSIKSITLKHKRSFLLNLQTASRKPAKSSSRK